MAFLGSPLASRAQDAKTGPDSPPASVVQGKATTRPIVTPDQAVIADLREEIAKLKTQINLLIAKQHKTELQCQAVVDFYRQGIIKRLKRNSIEGAQRLTQTTAVHASQSETSRTASGHSVHGSISVTSSFKSDCYHLPCEPGSTSYYSITVVDGEIREAHVVDGE